MENQNINLTGEWIQGAIGLIQSQLRVDELKEEVGSLELAQKVNAKKLMAEFNRLAAESQKAPQ